MGRLDQHFFGNLHMEKIPFYNKWCHLYFITVCTLPAIPPLPRWLFPSLTTGGCIIGAYVLYGKRSTRILVFSNINILFDRPFASLKLATPVEDCQAVVLISCWFEAIALPLNSMLFLIRILGVFNGSTMIKIGFAVLWLATLCSFIAPFVARATHIGPTKKCQINKVSAGSSSGFFVIAIYDTLVFIAITLRILSDNLTAGWRAKMKMFFSGGQMGPIFRMVLQTGQLYYL